MISARIASGRRPRSSRWPLTVRARRRSFQDAWGRDRQDAHVVVELQRAPRLRIALASDRHGRHRRPRQVGDSSPSCWPCPTKGARSFRLTDTSCVFRTNPGATKCMCAPLGEGRRPPGLDDGGSNPCGRAQRALLSATAPTARRPHQAAPRTRHGDRCAEKPPVSRRLPWSAHRWPTTMSRPTVSAS